MNIQSIKGIKIVSELPKENKGKVVFEPELKLLKSFELSELEYKILNSKVDVGILYTKTYGIDGVKSVILRYDSNNNVDCQGIGYFLDKLTKELRESEYNILVSIGKIDKEFNKYLGELI